MAAQYIILIQPSQFISRHRLSGLSDLSTEPNQRMVALWRSVRCGVRCDVIRVTAGLGLWRQGGHPGSRDNLKS